MSNPGDFGGSRGGGPAEGVLRKGSSGEAGVRGREGLRENGVSGGFVGGRGVAGGVSGGSLGCFQETKEKQKTNKRKKTKTKEKQKKKE